MGKIANPVTIKTFLPADEKVGDMTVAHYLARLAAEAVTVINAADYGRAIYDLATRRALITVGEDMVNIAYDAPVDMSPHEQIEDAERRLFELAETGRYDGGFESFTDAVKTAVDMANAAYMRDGHLSGIATGMRDLDRRMGGLQPSDLIVSPAAPAWARRRSPPTSPSTSPTPTSRRSRRTARSRRPMAASSASSRSKCRRSSSPPASSPSRPKSRPRRSGAARSPRPISRSWSPARR